MTTQPSSSGSRTRLSTGRLAEGRLVWATLIAFLMTVCVTSCALLQRKIVVIPEDKLVRFLPAGTLFKATNDVYLVPPARMQEILRALNSTNKI
jgi:hypothetical protein